MTRTSVRLAAVAVAAAPALLAPSVPASASDSYFSRTSGVAATTSWVQYFDFPDPRFGNVHVGDLYAFETSAGRADVFAFIADFECPEGVYPDTGGHGEEQPNGCTFVGTRTLEGQNLSFTVGRKLSTATLTGSLTAATGGDPHTGEGGETLGQVPIDATWTGTGDVVRTSSTYRYRENGTYASSTFRTTSQEATMSGRLGPMLFEEAYAATGRLEAFKSTDRYRSR